jgi:PAS domain S-box-containing protein
MTTPPEQLGKNSTSQEHPQLYAEQVRLLYSNALIGLIATLINSGALVFILRNIVPHRVLSGWLVCILLVSIARFVQFMRFRRVSPDSSDVGRWGTWFIVGLALSGILWGSTSVFFFPVESIIHQAFLAFVLGGMAIGAAGAFSVVMPAFIAYALPSLAPLIVRFLALGDEMHLAMGGMSLLFFVLMTGIALRINKVTVASLRLRFENSSLISYLSSAKDNLEKLNRELSSENVERRKAEEELKRHREHLEELVDNRTEELKAANIKLQQEISERRKLQDLLSLGKKEWEETFDMINDAITIHDKDFTIIRANKAAERMLGLSFREIIGQKCHQLYHGADAPTEGCASCLALKTGKPSTIETFEPHLDKYLEIKAIPQVDENNEVIKLVHVVRDITESKRSEALIRSSLLEKEILLKEIHHRVKNNLQVVASMLHLQSGYIKDSEARNLCEESQKRIESMALLHERLYRAKDLARIDFREYVADLVENLLTLNTDKASRIEMKLDIEGVMLDVNNSIPCGLIINELLSNALAHAFPDGRKGKIDLSMHSNSDNRIRLSVSDNGIGFPEDLDFRNTASLGMQLVNSLVLQLGGLIELDRSEGTAFRIEFQA